MNNLSNGRSFCASEFATRMSELHKNEIRGGDVFSFVASFWTEELMKEFCEASMIFCHSLCSAFGEGRMFSAIAICSEFLTLE
jgi:hypothetical protein